jgi:hypothetical protein
VSLSDIFARFVAVIGGMALVMRRLTGGAPEPAWGSMPAIPAAKPQGSIPTLKMPTARGWTQGQTPVAAPGLKVNAFATGLKRVRWIHVLPNRDVLVAEAANTPAATVAGQRPMTAPSPTSLTQSGAGSRLSAGSISSRIRGRRRARYQLIATRRSGLGGCGERMEVGSSSPAAAPAARSRLGLANIRQRPSCAATARLGRCSAMGTARVRAFSIRARSSAMFAQQSLNNARWQCPRGSASCSKLSAAALGI